MMAATGKTPILLYGSTTATNVPVAGNLTNSSDGCEIAINVADKNLFFKDSGNVVNTVPIRQSSGSSNGWLSSTDWTTFNNKQPAGTYVTSVTGTAPVVSSGGTTPAISMAAANGSTNGYLTSTDWTTFNGKAPAFTYTTNYIPYGQGTTTPTQSANLTFDGSTLSVFAASISSASVGGLLKFGADSNASSRPWLLIDNALAYGDFAFQQGSTNTGGTYTTKVYLGASGGVSIGNTTDPGAGKLSVTNGLSVGTTSTTAVSNVNGSQIWYNPTQSYGEAKVVYAASAFNNPTVNLFSFAFAGAGTQYGSLIAKITVFQNGWGYGGANIHQGFATISCNGSGGYNAGQVSTMTTVQSFSNTNVGTLSWSGQTLQYTGNRASNYDTYVITIEIGFSGTTMQTQGITVTYGTLS